MHNKALNLDTTGILAGGGEVPIEIANAIAARGENVYIVAIDSKVSQRLSDLPHECISLGQIGRMLSLFRRNRCRRLVISGNLSRPDISKLRIDLGFLLHIRVVLSLLRGGDDQILRRVIGFFERQGFQVVGIPEVAPGLIAGEGMLAGNNPVGNEDQDAMRGYQLIRSLGPFDIGQAVVVKDGKIIAVEGVDGTDAMLDRLASTKEALLSGGTLIKATKPGQELRIDLPTIGVATVKACSKTGLKMIAIEAGRSVIAERKATLKQASDASIRILGLPKCAETEDFEHNILAWNSELSCLTRYKGPKKHLADAIKGLRAVRVLKSYATNPSIIIARQHILAVNVGEANEAFLERATVLRQWGDKRKRNRQGLVVLSSLEDMTQTNLQNLVQNLAKARFAGLVIDQVTSVSSQLPIYADRFGLFIWVRV